jgi:hypothetical protein
MTESAITQIADSFSLRVDVDKHRYLIKMIPETIPQEQVAQCWLNK